MIEIQELSDPEIEAFLQRVSFGHLACSYDDVPYVVPIHFAFADGEIVVYSTEGKKSEIIAKNPNVCLQAEDITDNHNWESVIVNGTARRIEDATEREAALKLIASVNPTLTPAVSIRWMDNWVRENIEVVYRIKPLRTSGRKTASRGDSAHVFPGGRRSKDTIF
ncbi:MAG: pyridoxamine 5'-phosphate oxidase family protein [Acidobacteriota bacterium]